jgi:UDP-2,3-diacylglucosamine hydrolase
VHRLDALGIIAGSGVYPLLLAQSARRAGVPKIVAAAFAGETDPTLERFVDDVQWMRVGQLGRLLNTFGGAGIRQAVMAGQIAPSNLFNVRPDVKTLLLLARVKQRNAETLFGAIADELAAVGVELLPAFSFLEDHLATVGLIAGRAPNRREQADVEFGFRIAKEVSRLDIGQTVVVRGGTVVAVEAFEGTNGAIKRGGALAQKNAVAIKVSKPNQDMRFDVPVIGPQTISVAAEANVRVIAVEAGKTLLLDKQELADAAVRARISIVGC